MYKLWYMADLDLLSTTNAYQLLNTGQGLNRVQHCPMVGREMSRYGREEPPTHPPIHPFIHSIYLMV